MSMQKSGNDIGVVSCNIDPTTDVGFDPYSRPSPSKPKDNIDPTTDVGAWAGEGKSGNDYPLALTDLDVSMVQ
jgi:hypothetical protein